MRGVVMHGPGDVRVEEREDPKIVEPTDAIIRSRRPASAARISGPTAASSRRRPWPMPMGHEYVGVVEEVGADVETIKPGEFVVGSFWALRQHLPDLPGGIPERVRPAASRMGALGAQAELLRVPLADGTLVVTPGHPAPTT